MDRTDVMSHVKSNKYQVFLVKGIDDNEDEFYVLGVDSFTGFGRDTNEVLATNLHYDKEDLKQNAGREEEFKNIIRASRMLDMQDDVKNFGIDYDKVNWTPIQI